MMRDKLIEKRFIYFNRTKENCQKIILTSLYFQWQSPESLFVAFLIEIFRKIRNINKPLPK